MINENKLLEYKRKYAKLIVRRGLNFNTPRFVRIYANLDDPEFIHMIVNECYDLGAKRVRVTWNYNPIERLIYENTNLDDLIKMHTNNYRREKIKASIKGKVLNIYVESDDPVYLKGIDPTKISALDQARRAIKQRYRHNKVTAPYVIVSMPSIKWAKFLFPNLEDKQAVNKLWECIFKACFIDDNDPLINWDNHSKEIDNRAKWLNSLNIKSLHYKSKNGTDLTVGLTKNYCFASTSDFDVLTKRKYYSNLPCDECFVSPHRLKTSGVVYSTKPLCNNGQLIEDFYFRFKKGKIVEVHAKKNEKLLKTLVNADKNSCYLGEAALVPFSSPINKMGILFYTTLYDENACCHFAFGDCYPYTYKGYEKMSRAELKKVGLNFSNTHIDFMIGSADLSIVATTHDNKEIAIFKNGEWAK